jgi:hypothetical protein
MMESALGRSTAIFHLDIVKNGPLMATVVERPLSELGNDFELVKRDFLLS